MPNERAGYCLTVFALDVSASMGGQVAIGDDGCKRSKLDLAKEYIARTCEPRISSGRKTEAVGLLSFGGRTNNQANQAARKERPEDEDPPYEFIACDVAVQTVRPKTLEVLMNLELGKEEGNPVSALMVALDMVSVHKHTKSWSLEVILITDGESSFAQDEYEDLITRFEDMGVKLTVLGVGFEPLGETVDKSKPRNKRLSEKFWRTFVQLLHDRFSGVNASDDFLPTIQVFDDALADARKPHPEQKNGTVSNIDLLIGSPDIDPEQAIRIPVKYSKATMKARPPTLSRAWRPAMDLQPSLHPSAQRSFQTPQSQLLSSYVDQQSQQHGLGQGGASQSAGGVQADVAGMISSEVKGYSTYVVKKEPLAPPPASQDDVAMADSQAPGSQRPPTQSRTQAEEEPEEEEEEVVAKEDLVKAWRFGSTWVPMEADTFEPMVTQKGVEVLGFFPRANLKRHHLMGEVRFVWPDITDAQAQIKYSSFVAGLILREMVAVVRWVHKDQAEPVIGVCIPEQDFPGDEKRLDFMFWVKLPFAEDEHNFWFPSLTTYKTSAGKVLEEHPLLPTDEQCDLMDLFVQSMDLDAFAEAQGDEDEPGEPWFDTVNSFNPAIHRIKEAIFHASLTRDLDKDPLGPPHPEIVKYLDPPAALVGRSEKIVGQLKEALDIKKVPAKVRMQKRAKEGLREDEGYIDIDALFDDPDEDDDAADRGKGKAKADPGTPPQKVKPEPSSANGKSGTQIKDEPNRTPSKHKPKRGRIISNEAPLEDFNRLISGEGDVFRKAIQDLGAVVRENVEASFSRQAFPLAVECLQAMRKTALVYEEVDTYNTFVDEFKEFIHEPKFKHKDFWKEEAGDAVAPISEEEEEAALQD